MAEKSMRNSVIVALNIKKEINEPPRIVPLAVKFLFADNVLLLIDAKLTKKNGFMSKN